MDVCIFYIQKHSLLRSLEDTVLGRGESGVKATNMGISSPASSYLVLVCNEMHHAGLTEHFPHCSGERIVRGRAGSQPLTTELTLVCSLAGPGADERSWPGSQGQLVRRLHGGFLQRCGAESHVCPLHRDGVACSGSWVNSKLVSQN